MAYEVEITASAYDDISVAFKYYRSISPKLADKFYEDVLTQLFHLRFHPNYYSFYRGDFRKKLLSRFPYLIIFKIIDQRVVVFAVIYGGTNPATISKKIS